MNNVIFHKQNHIDQAWNVHRMKNKIAGNVRKCYVHNIPDGLYDWPLTRISFSDLIIRYPDVWINVRLIQRQKAWKKLC